MKLSKKVIVLIGVIFVLLPRLSNGAIVFDAYTNGGTGASPLTVAATVSTTANGLLIVETFGDVNNDNVSGVTFNGTAMTKVGAAIGATLDRYSQMWYLLSPATGTHNVVVSGPALTSMAASSFVGVGGFDASTTNSCTNCTSLTTTLTTIHDNSWTFVGARASNVTQSAGAGATSRAATQNNDIYDSNGVIHPAGNNSMTVNCSGCGTTSNGIGAVMASFYPFVANTPCRIKVIGACH